MNNLLIFRFPYSLLKEHLDVFVSYFNDCFSFLQLVYFVNAMRCSWIVSLSC